MPAKFFNYNRLALSAMLLLGALIYSNTFGSAFHLDDLPSILNNPAITNISNLQDIWNFWPSRFITYLSIALNYHFSRLTVFSYHLFNLIIHLGSGILVWQLLLLIFSTPAIRGERIAQHAKLLALFSGLIFIAHPIQTQGVTYIIQRAASLATFFYLLALYLYAKFRLLQEQGGSQINIKLHYGASLGIAVVAMFTKESTITLPIMIISYELFFLKTERKIYWKNLVPFLITLLIIPATLLLTKYVNLIGMRRAIEEPVNISSFHYLLTQFRVAVTYLRLLFIPINQNLDYYYPLAKNLFSLPILASAMLLGGIIITAVKLFAKYRLISFSILWFFLTLLPESSVIPIRDVIFEHRLYLPMAGYSFFLVSAVYYLFKEKRFKLAIGVLLIITFCYGLLAYQRNFVWKDELTLWSDVVLKSPQKARGYNNRGAAYCQQNNLAKAVANLNVAIGINPDYAEAYCNRGIAYARQSNYTLAALDYSRAAEIKPSYAEAYNGRGAVYFQQGNFNNAITDINRAIAIRPEYAEAYYNLGVIFSQQGKYDQAILNFTRAIQINPNYADAYYNRGIAYFHQEKLTQAILDYSKTILLAPNYLTAYNNRAICYYFIKQYALAWIDVHKLQKAGEAIHPDFIAALKQASEKDK